MTIRTDLDAAISEAQARGVGIASMRLRMGPSALLALAILERGEGFEEGAMPESYSGVPIEAVGGPGGTDQRAVRADAFNGWELVG